MESKKETFFLYNNLTCLVKALEGRYTTIDLRDESCVTGRVLHVDGYMNVDLEDAVLYDGRGGEVPFAAFFVRARLVRYVHIPADMSIPDAVRNQMKPRRKSAPVRKPALKAKRAHRYQQETLAELATNK